MNKKGFYEKIIKRPFDLIAALSALVLLSPLLVIIAILIRTKLGSPVIFKQKRPGLNGKIFTLIKFRTMTNNKDPNGNLLNDSLRLTSFGKFLRSTSIDELPGLFNVIKGDMSLVGPRPLLIDYLDLYNEQQKKRHNVKPGLSGLAQIKGRNSISWEKKLEWDVVYVDNVTFLNDIKIILITLVKVIQRKDITSVNSVSTERFNGKN